jgi:hypothetical protein
MAPWIVFYIFTSIQISNKMQQSYLVLLNDHLSLLHLVAYLCTYVIHLIFKK